jgi:hypothetical protein
MTFEEDAAAYLSDVERYRATYASSFESRKPPSPMPLMSGVDASNGGTTLERDNDGNELPGGAGEFASQEVVIEVAGHPYQHRSNSRNIQPVDGASASATADQPMTAGDQATQLPTANHPPSVIGLTADRSAGQVTVLHGIVSPHDNDVKCGRGKPAEDHAGNKWYLDRVNEKRTAYNEATSQLSNRLIAKEIVDLVKNRHPPGRFLKRDPATRLWNEIGDDEAIAKAGQALREKPPAQGSEGGAVVDRRPRQPAQIALDPVRRAYTFQCDRRFFEASL